MTELNLPLEDSPYKLDGHGPVFILGCPRSGTTFLSKCVGAIKGVEEFVGVLCPPRMCHLLATEDRPDREELLMASIRDVFWNSFWRRRYFRSERLCRLLYRRLSLKEFFAAPTMAGSLFCYKEPFLCFAADKFANHFPNAKFIHIIRDGRDNADSLERTYPDALSDAVLTSDDLTRNKNSEIGLWKSVNGVNIPWWVPESDVEQFSRCSRYERCVIMWREMTLRGRALRKIADSRYLEVKYEDFVREPLRWGKSIIAFLDRDYGPRVHTTLSKAFTKSIGVAKHNQQSEKILQSNAIAGTLLSELGYQ